MSNCHSYDSLVAGWLWWCPVPTVTLGLHYQAQWSIIFTRAVQEIKEEKIGKSWSVTVSLCHFDTTCDSVGTLLLTVIMTWLAISDDLLKCFWFLPPANKIRNVSKNRRPECFANISIKSIRGPTIPRYSSSTEFLIGADISYGLFFWGLQDLVF